MSSTYEKSIGDAVSRRDSKRTAVKRNAVAVVIVLMLIAVMIPRENSANVYAASGDVQTWYDCLDKLAGKMETDHFWYSNSHNSRSYAGARKGTRVSNCARYVTWALQDYGVIRHDKVFWFRKGGAIGGDSSYITNNSKVKILHPNKPAVKCNLKPGDICGWDNMQHTAVYAGRAKDGRLLWYSAGRDGGTKSRGRTYFKAGKVKARCRGDRYNSRINTVIRIREFKSSSGKSKAAGKSVKNNSKAAVTKESKDAKASKNVSKSNKNMKKSGDKNTNIQKRNQCDEAITIVIAFD